MLIPSHRHPDLALFQTIDNLECRFDEPLDEHTSMKMKSRAELFAIAHTPRALRDTLALAHRRHIPLYVLGGGTNSLFATSRFEGVVLQLGEGFTAIEQVDDTLVRVGAGLPLKKAASFTLDCPLSGMEFSVGIPGTVGGAAAGNAGARDAEGKEVGICDFIERLICFDRTGQVWEVERGEFQYTYRASELNQVIVAEMDLRLSHAPREVVHNNLQHFREKRKGQPYGLPSCGCIFKNPTDPATGRPVSAGKVIDSIGLKGYRLGDAEISDKHANFMVNRRSASAEDFLALISLTQDIVRQKMGIDLDVEVKVIGGAQNHAIL